MDSEIQNLTPNERSQYVSAWRTYKVLRNITVGSVLATAVFGFLGERRPGSILLICALVAFIVLIAAALMLEYWQCPRCHKTFGGGLFQGRTRQPLVRKCNWCELSKTDLRTLTRN
jgi:hypothetical protein